MQISLPVSNLDTELEIQENIPKFVSSLHFETAPSNIIADVLSFIKQVTLYPSLTSQSSFIPQTFTSLSLTT